MIAPITIRQLVADTRLDATRRAIVAKLAALLPGVAVVGHPGKLDINDVVAKAIVTAPGVAVGYTRVREAGDMGGTFSAVVDWAAYVVAEDYLDTGATPPRVVGRETVGFAIGLQLLRILRDLDAPSWDLVAIDAPQMDPGPALVPLITVKTETNMTATYAVTWTQALVQEGKPYFDGDTPGTEGVGGPEDPVAGLPAAGAADDEIGIDLPAGDLNDYPPELRALMAEDVP